MAAVCEVQQGCWRPVDALRPLRKLGAASLEVRPPWPHVRKTTPARKEGIMSLEDKLAIQEVIAQVRVHLRFQGR